MDREYGCNSWVTRAVDLAKTGNAAQREVADENLTPVAAVVEPAYILALSCQDRVGMVAAVSSYLAGLDGFILDSQQYADLETERFFLRVEFKSGGERFPATMEELRAGLESIGQRFAMSWDLLPSAHRPKLLIAVSKASHCLNDLLHRWHTGNLPVEIAGVVSNHPDLRELTEWHGIPFHHLGTSINPVI